MVSNIYKRLKSSMMSQSYQHIHLVISTKTITNGTFLSIQTYFYEAFFNNQQKKCKVFEIHSR